MRAKEYLVLEHAVEIGVNFGWLHAHKHVDKPSEQQIKEQVEADVMNSICEWFDFGEEETIP